MTLGMLGGGQLGRMFAAAARRLDCRVVVLDPDPHSPAGQVADRHLARAYDDAAALDELAAECDAVGYEFENIPIDSARRLAARVPVRPGPEALAVSQSRTMEKDYAAQHAPDAPPVPHRAVADAEQLEDALAGLGAPCLLKTDRLGYDGKGQRRVADAPGARAAFAELGGAECVLEKELELEREVSVLVAGDGAEYETYPVIENEHRRGILHRSRAPAELPAEQAATARGSALALARSLGYRGVLAVEYFLARDGRVYFNEMAPRPHNSGHHTIDSCDASQFEQQARALRGLPPAPATQRTAAAMINLLGDLWTNGEPDWRPLERDPAVRLHLYGKRAARPGRKMGHFCVLDDDPDAAAARADELYRELAA